MDQILDTTDNAYFERQLEIVERLWDRLAGFRRRFPFQLFVFGISKRTVRIFSENYNRRVYDSRMVLIYSCTKRRIYITLWDLFLSNITFSRATEFISDNIFSQKWKLAGLGEGYGLNEQFKNMTF